MGTIARTAKSGGGTNFNSGQTIDPAEVNTDFNTAYTELNGLLDDGNIETATIPGAKSLRFTEIANPSAPSSNDLLLFGSNVDGGLRAMLDSGEVVDLGGVIGRDVVATSVTNTVTETTVFTHTVQGGTLGTTHVLRFVAFGTYTNNTGANRTVTFRVKYDTTTMYAHASGNLATSASARGWGIEGYIAANNSTNSQDSFFRSTIGAVTTVDGNGEAAAETFVATGFALSSEDSTGDLAVTLTIEHSNADTTAACRIAYLALL